jgi:large subunit ribosomal protein L35
MPKMKSKSSAKKRFAVTGKGKVKRGSAFTSHMMMNKPKKMKRKANRTTVMEECDAKVVLTKWLPYKRKNKNQSAYNPDMDPANKGGSK